MPTLLHGIGILLAYVAALFKTSVAFVAERAGRETQTLEVACSKPIHSKVILI